MKYKILYIEDEPYLGKIVEETLQHRGFEVLRKKDGTQISQQLREFMPDICVLDVMLPVIDGFSLGKEIRRQYPLLPVIFLTAKSQTEDLLKGFESGGTDYIKKPFSIEELIARISNQLSLKQGRLQEKEQPRKMQIGSCMFDNNKYELQTSGELIKLSHRESQLLKMLALNQNMVIERKALLLEVWGDDSFFNSRTLDVYIRKLRGYFLQEKDIEIITLKGKGYHFMVGNQSSGRQ